jgi:hypothetical protein
MCRGKKDRMIDGYCPEKIDNQVILLWPNQIVAIKIQSPMGVR